MKVNSPVGEYDYRVTSVRLAPGGRIVVAGNLGVWDTTMEIEPADWAALARRAAVPAGVVAAAVLLASVLRRH
jgi:hypothetical protein